MPILLTRSEFREQVFARNHHRCVVCGCRADDPHHILERKLWPDGGYYTANGAGLCNDCHLNAENSLISPKSLRYLCGISDILLPPGLDPKYQYDKWGTPWEDINVCSYREDEIWFVYDHGNKIGVIHKYKGLELEGPEPTEFFRRSLLSAVDRFKRARIMNVEPVGAVECP